MSNIVVCKKWRQIEQSKGEFVINEHRKLIRSSVKISEQDAKNFNSISKKTGIVYEVGKEATKKRDELLAPKPDRKALILEAETMELEFPKNIKTDALINLINLNK